MDPLDILTVAVHAAQLIRSGKDPETALAGAHKVLRLKGAGKKGHRRRCATGSASSCGKALPRDVNA
jgi:hypothetical protein